MDKNKIAYPVFEVSDVNQVTAYLNEEDIKSLEFNDFEVSGAKLIDSEGYEILVKCETKKSTCYITKLVDFFRGGQTVAIKGRGERDLSALKIIVFNFYQKNQIASPDDWEALLQKIRSSNDAQKQ